MLEKQIQRIEIYAVDRIKMIKDTIQILRSKWSFSILVIIILHIAFFALASIYKGIYTGDSPEYLIAAENISLLSISYNGSLYEEINPIFFSLRPPGYSLFILMCKNLYNSDLIVLAFQNICSVIILCYIILRLEQNLYTKQYKWLVVVGLIFFPVYMIMVNMIMADSLLGSILFISWVFADRFINTKNWHFLLLYNIGLCCAVLVKPVMMYFWIPNLLFSIYLSWKIKKLYPVFMSLLLAFTTGAWSYRNYIKTDYFHYSSIKMQNLLELNAGAIMSYRYDYNYMMKHRRLTINNANTLNSFKGRSEFLLDEAKKVLVEHPFLYSFLHARGMINFMLAPGTVDIKTFFRQDLSDPISLLYEIEKKGLIKGFVYYINNVDLVFVIVVFLTFAWNVFSLLLFLAAFGSSKIGVLQRISLFLLLFYIVFACGPGGYARFKISIYPFILYLIPFGYQVVIDKINRLRLNPK